MGKMLNGVSKMISHGNSQGDSSIASFSMNHTKSSASLITDATAPMLNNEDELSKVQIYKDLCSYESTLSQLVGSVDNFKPDVNIAKKLIEVDKSLFESLKSFAEYDEIDLELRRLDSDFEELDRKTKEVLGTLNDCYNQLNALPMLEQVVLEKQIILKQRAKINSSVLLEYATKLSKFTKIPPTFDKGSIGPNNFIWPAEDALRRGMLAMASLHAQELTKIPGEEGEQNEEEIREKALIEEEQGIDQSVEQEHQSQDQEQHVNKTGVERPQNGRRQSYVFTGDGESLKDKSDDAIDLDLDLFNADEF